MFGIGMQLGGGCGSGTLFTVGGGSSRMAVTLAAFIAGRVDSLAEAAGDQLGEALGSASAGVVGKAGSAILGKLIGKTAEGAVNGLFVYRLGKAAIKRLRPIG